LLENYLIIPLRVDQADISADAIRLYGHILFLSRKTGYCFATNDYLSKRLKRSTRSTKRYLAELSKSNFIKIEYPDTKDKTKRKLYPLGQIWPKLGPRPPEKFSSLTYIEEEKNKNNISLSVPYALEKEAEPYDLDKEIEEIINQRNK
jgi:hypothetical protein